MLGKLVYGGSWGAGVCEAWCCACLGRERADSHACSVARVCVGRVLTFQRQRGAILKPHGVPTVVQPEVSHVVGALQNALVGRKDNGLGVEPAQPSGRQPSMSANGMRPVSFNSHHGLQCIRAAAEAREQHP